MLTFDEAFMYTLRWQRMRLWRVCRNIAALILCIGFPACSGTEPSSSSNRFGKWELREVNGQPLPSTERAFPRRTVTARVLTLVDGAHGSALELCREDSQQPGHTSYTIQSVFSGDRGDEFVLRYDFLGAIPDTGIVTRDTMRLAFTNGYGRAQGMDTLYFTRLPVNAPNREDANVCYLP